MDGRSFSFQQIPGRKFLRPFSLEQNPGRQLLERKYICRSFRYQRIPGRHFPERKHACRSFSFSVVIERLPVIQTAFDECLNFLLAFIPGFIFFQAYFVDMEVIPS